MSSRLGDRASYCPPSQLPYGPDSLSWRVNLEPVLLMGGGRALLLQVAHPLVAAGVDQFSDYSQDPWGRLSRTLDVVFKMAFAAPDVSARHARALEAKHRRVVGESPDGVPYQALDPVLLVWVWATLVDTALCVYERCFGRMSDVARERFYEEQKLLAYASGVPVGGCPEVLADFQSYWAAMVAGELHVTPAAHAVAHAVTGPVLRPPLDPLVRGANRLVTTGLLPASVRDQYGLAWSDGDQRRLRAWFAAVGTVSRLVPRQLRQAPSVFMARRDRPAVLPTFLQARRPGRASSAANGTG
jgi:uncharacterized protein (DUF2236 family)